MATRILSSLKYLCVLFFLSKGDSLWNIRWTNNYGIAIKNHFASIENLCHSVWSNPCNFILWMYVDAILHYESWHQPFITFVFNEINTYSKFALSLHLCVFGNLQGKKPPNFDSCCCCFALHELLRMYNLNDLFLDVTHI